MRKLKNLYNKRLCLSVGILAFCVVLNYLVSVFSIVFGADEREHLHAAFMVYDGRVPYVDFFEHHHPLFWYILQPFVHFFGNNPFVWVYGRGLVCLINAGIVYFIYKICRQAEQSPKAAVLAAAGWFAFYAVQRTGAELRPDLLMILFYLAGLNCFFDYLKSLRYGMFLASFVLFFCSFLTLQKVVVLLLGQGLIILWLAYKKRIVWFDLLLAGGTVAVLLLVTAGALYQAGALKIYFEQNWLLNLHIRIMSMLTTRDFYVFIFGAVLGVGVLFCSHNEVMRCVAFLYLFISGGLLIWRPWFYQYLLPYVALVTIIFGYVLYEPFLKFRFAAVVLLILAGFSAKEAYDKWVLSKNDAFRLGIYSDVLAFMLQKTAPGDLVLGNGEDMVSTMRHSALGYYWFSVGFVSPLDAQLFYKKELPDYDLIIKIRKPKAVINGFWRNCALGDMYITNRDCPYWEKVDRDYLKQHYTDYGFVFIRND